MRRIIPHPCRASAGPFSLILVVLQQAAALAQGITNLLPQLGALSVILPPDTLAWKLRMLDTGNQFIKDRLKSVSQRVLLLVGDGDLLLPSGNEGKRLARELPRCVSKVMASRLSFATCPGLRDPTSRLIPQMRELMTFRALPSERFVS